MKSKLKKTFSSPKLRKITFLSIPVIALIAVVLFVTLSRDNRTSQAANVELEEKLADGGKLTVLEIVPDECQAQFAYLVEGQEPIADKLYSTTKSVRESLTADMTDIQNYANIAYDASDSSWHNKNDFLGYVFNGYELSDTGMYVAEVIRNADNTINESVSGSIVEIKADASGNLFFDATSEYSGTPNPDGHYVLGYDGKYFEAAVDETGAVLRYKVREKIGTDQIQFYTMTPAQLDARIASEKDFLLTCDLICIEKGSYGHLEVITNKYKYNNTHNSNATYQTNDFKWSTIEALYEYAGKLKKPVMMDSSLSGTSSTNLKRLYLMLRVMPYTTFKDIYDHINHTNGDLNYTASVPNPWSPGSNMNHNVTWDLTSLENYYLYMNGYTYSNHSEEYDVDENGDPEVDRYGNIVYKSYIVGDGARMDNLVDNIFLFKGEDISLGDRFKYVLFGNSDYFTEVPDVLDDINNKNRITNASVLKYLLNLNSSTALRHKIQILEVEPSVDFKYATRDESTSVYSFKRNDAEIRELLIAMGYLPTAKSIENVEVVTLYSGAFAGYKKDLTSYEYIYIGNRQGKINDGTPLYRFTGLDNIKPTGNLNTYSNPATGKIFDSTGNDITNWIKEGLIKYVRARKVLMLGSDLYDLKATTVTSNSILYKTVSELKALGSKTFVSDAKEGVNLVNAFARATATPEIIMTSKPLDYYDEATGAYQTVPATGSKVDSTGNIISTFTYNFTYTIKGQPNTKYKTFIYLDINGDGMFIDYTDGDFETEEVYVSDVYTTDASGRLMTNVGGVKATTYLNATVQLPDNTFGMVPWKLAVVECDDAGNPTYNLMSEIGYSVVKPATKKTVFALHIVPDDGGAFVMDTTPTTSAAPYEADYLHYSGGVKQMTVTDANKKNKRVTFQEKVGMAVDYDIQIYSITKSMFESWYTNGRKTKFYMPTTTRDRLELYDGTGHEYDPDNKDSYDYLSDVFDLIIFGFGDVYNNNRFSNVGNSVINLYDYAKSGRSVLMAHDLIMYDTLYDTTTGGANMNNRIFAKYFRDISGQDRFGYMHMVVDSMLQDSDAYSDPTGLTMGQYIGYSSENVLRYNNTKYIDSTKFYNGGNNETTQTLQLNRGPITEYPFHLGESIKVARTHSQYFSLNLEDKDVQVWYTLAGKGSQGQFLNNRLKDARDNFYVYTNGSVTYTGAGHTGFENIENDEMELFINTIIAAIKVGNHAPVVTVTNAAVSRTGDCNYLKYVGDNDTDTYLNFIVQDIDLVSGAPIRDVKVYWDKNENKKYDEGTDVLLSSYAGAIRNDVFETAYNTVYFPTKDGKGTDYFRDTYGVTSSKRDIAVGTDLSEILPSVMSTHGEHCVYITITATDAKGAAGTAVVKVKMIELYELD